MVEYKEIRREKLFSIAKSNLAGLWDVNFLPEMHFQHCTKQGASAAVPMGSSGQSKQAAWQRSLNEHKKAGCRVVFEQRDSERSKTGKPSHAKQYSVS